MKTAVKKLLVLLGPTASGKTDLSLILAKEFNGFIISADSRQLYSGMDIGTNKLPRNAREGIRHEMLDLLKPNETWTLAQYQDAARRIIQKTRNLPILVGGTGLYIRAIVDNFEIPKVTPDPDRRKAWEKFSAEKLYQRLAAIDPETAEVIDRHNKRRLIRALEVVESTGRSFRAQQKAHPIYDTLQIGLLLDREELYRRIDQRVDEMMSDELLEEVRMIGTQYGWDCAGMSALGYRQLAPAIHNATLLPKCIEQLKHDTRRYAKRQMTWFRRDPRIRWIKNSQETISLVKQWL
jgi:tRNA dimethylallyltransferase